MHLMPAVEVEILRIVRPRGLREAENPGVVHQYIQTTILLLDDREGLLPLLFSAHIELPIQRALAQLSRDLLSGGVLNISKYDDRALLMKTLRDRTADTAGGASYQCHLSIQPRHSTLLE